MTPPPFQVFGDISSEALSPLAVVHVLASAFRLMTLALLAVLLYMYHVSVTDF